MATVAMSGLPTKNTLRALAERVRQLIEQLPDDSPPPGKPSPAPREVKAGTDRKAA